MFIFPNKPRVLNKKENWASFEIEGLYPGYGVTIGNSLRRVLLSSLEGAAVTQVKMKNVQHEFSTISGVLEDVIIITTNLKQMRFKLHSDEPQKATLKVKGEKEVKGSDFEFPSQIELINRFCHIATLTDKKAELEMEIQVEKGVGYESVEMRNKNKRLEVGAMPVDAIYTPIKRVNYKTENMRVGDRTDFDRLMLDIETDGTIEAEDAFFKACEILLKHFSLIAEPFGKIEISEKTEQEEIAETVDKSEGEEKTKIEDLKLSGRTLSALINNNIKTVAGLLRKNEKLVLELEGMGEKGLKEIKKALKKIGLELKGE